MSGVDPDFQLARIHGNLVAMRDLPPGRSSECLLGPHQCQEMILLLEHLAYRGKNAEQELAQRTAERDEARRSACTLQARYMNTRIGFCPMTDDHANTEARKIAARMGWDCFDAKEGER